ncbi:MAG: GAF domain-containing protein, partial [Anaerolineales bacterium]|nr:GAF domain-containing protein [Anaerolineales bacterium]
RLIFDQIRFIDAEGQEVARVNTTRDGVSTIVPLEDLQNKADRYYFTDSIGLAAGEIFISPLDLNVEHGEIETPHKPVIRYATPVVFDGETRGIIIINVLADGFLDKLGSTSLSTVLIDEGGYYLYHPDENLRWGRDLGTGATIEQDFPELTTLIFSGATDTLLASDQFFAYAPVTLPGETSPRWFIANFVTEKDAFTPLTSARNSGIVLLVAILVSVTALGLVFSRALTKPLLDLTQTAKKVMAGDLQARAEKGSSDEIGILAHVFNSLVDRLHNLISSLEQRVSERTAGLEESAAHIQKTVSQLETVADVARLVASIQDVDQLLPYITEIVSERFGFYHTGIFLLDESKNLAVLHAANSTGGKKMLARKHTLRVGKEGIVGYAAAEKTARIALDVGQDAVFFNNPDLPTTHSEMALPMVVGEDVIGILDIQSEETGAFSTDDIEVLTILADQVAIAIENTRLYEQSQQALDELEHTLQQYVRNEWRHFGEVTKLKGYRSQPTKIEPIRTSLQMDGKAKKDAYIFKVPVKLRDVVIGYLDVDLNKPLDDYTQDELDIIQATVDRFALALENARLLEETSRRAGRERLVSEITTKIRQTNDPQVMIETAMEELKNALGVKNIQVVPHEGAGHQKG